MKNIFSFLLAGTLITFAACDSASVKTADNKDSGDKKNRNVI